VIVLGKPNQFGGCFKHSRYFLTLRSGPSLIPASVRFGKRNLCFSSGDKVGKDDKVIIARIIAVDN
jgi:hypothetical protein